MESTTSIRMKIQAIRLLDRISYALQGHVIQEYQSPRGYFPVNLDHNCLLNMYPHNFCFFFKFFKFLKNKNKNFYKKIIFLFLFFCQGFFVRTKLIPVDSSRPSRCTFKIIQSYRTGTNCWIHQCSARPAHRSSSKHQKMTVLVSRLRSRSFTEWTSKLVHSLRKSMHHHPKNQERSLICQL